MIASDSTTFLQDIRPLLCQGDLDALADCIRQGWSVECLGKFLQSPCRDARLAAAIAIGLVAQVHVTPWLAEALHDSSDLVAKAAEQSLWRVWFRAGNGEATPRFCAGLRALSRSDYPHAVAEFTAATEADPTFAEAFNQRGLVHHLCHNYETAIEDCMAAVNRIPLHFEALAQVGHGHAELGDLRRAMMWYRRALQVNPRHEAAAEACERIRASLV